MEYDLGNGIYACLDKPVVVSTSKVGEKRWGFHQFVSISEYPGDEILLRYHVGEDAVKAYGTPSPTFITTDKGKNWELIAPDSLLTSGLTYPLLNGHFICLPMAKAINLKDAIAEVELYFSRAVPLDRPPLPALLRVSLPDHRIEAGVGLQEGVFIRPRALNELELHPDVRLRAQEQQTDFVVSSLVAVRHTAPRDSAAALHFVHLLDGLVERGDEPAKPVRLCQQAQ